MTRSRIVRRVRVRGRDLVVKRASGGNRVRLRREAELLELLAGEGVVDLVALHDGDDRTDLVMPDGGTDASRVRLGSVDEVLALGRGALAALTALHDRGWAHGALCAEHVVVDDDGVVRLVSVGSARPLGGSDGAAATERRELVRLLVGCLGRVECSGPATRRLTELRRVRRLRSRLQDLLADGGGAAVGIHALAQLLGIRDDTDDEEPDVDRSAPERVRPGHDGSARLRPVASGAALLVLVAGVGALGLGLGASGSTGDPVAREGPAPGAAGARVAGNLVELDGTTYRVGRPGDRPVVDDWLCDGSSAVLVLRPGTGEVIGFPGWASDDHPVDGRVLDVVEGARELVPLDGTAGSSGCPTAGARLADGTLVELGLDHLEPDASGIDPNGDPP